jgi:O-antigen ligase
MRKRIEWLVALFILIFYAGLLTPSEAAEGGHDIIMSQVSILVQTIVIPLTFLLMIANWGRMIAGVRVTLLPVAVSLLLFLSTAWSVEPHITLRRSIIFVFSTIFAVYLGACLSNARQIHIYASVSLISVVGCFLIAAILGGRPFRSRWLRWGSLLGAVALLGLSRSGTSLYGFVALMLGYFIVKVARVKDRKTLPLWVALVPMGLVFLFTAFVLRDQLFALIGKDSSLTGRTTIWAFAIQNMFKEPFLGHGYAVFWRQKLIGQSLPQGLQATHAHDGYFDVVLDTGFFGLALLATTFFVFIARCTRKLFDQKIAVSDLAFFGFLFAFMFVAMNLTESNLLREHTFLWLPFVSIYTGLGMQQQAERRARVEEQAKSEAETLEYQVA